METDDGELICIVGPACLYIQFNNLKTFTYLVPSPVRGCLVIVSHLTRHSVGASNESTEENHSW